MKNLAIALAVSTAALLGGPVGCVSAGTATDNAVKANPAARSTDLSSGGRHHWRHHRVHRHWRYGHYRPYYGSYGYYGAPYYYGGAPIVTFGFGGFGGGWHGGGWHHHHHH